MTTIRRGVVMRKQLILMVFLALATSAAGVEELMSFQGDVRQGGALVNGGNLTVVIYDAAIGGNEIYNESYTNVVNNGRFDVLLGNTSTDLLMNFSQKYYLDFYVNGNKITTNRQEFQNGMVRGLFVDVGRYANMLGVNTTATGIGSMAAGYAVGDINATNQGSIAVGQVSEAGNSILSTALGSFAGGRATGIGSTNSILASGDGSFAYGLSNFDGGAGQIAASDSGTFAHGYVSNAFIKALAQGAFAQGYANNAGLINASGEGSTAQGYASQGIIETRTGARGSLAFGNAGSADNYIRTNTNAAGSFAGGYVNGIGQTHISSHGQGALAYGYVDGEAAESAMEARGRGSVAMGAIRQNGTINSTQDGSFALGYANLGETLESQGTASFALGRNNSVTGNYSFAFGRSVNVPTDYHAEFFSTAYPGNLTVNGQLVCLEDGSNCPNISGGSNDTPWTNDTDSVFIKTGYPEGIEVGPNTISNGTGTFAMGEGESNSAIIKVQETSNGSFAHGVARQPDGVPAAIEVKGNAYGATAQGYAEEGFIIVSPQSHGSTAKGFSDEGNITAGSSAHGSSAEGYAITSGKIYTGNQAYGSEAQGYTENSGNVRTGTTARGSTAKGCGLDNGNISTGEDAYGSTAQGCTFNGTIATGDSAIGSHAKGQAESGTISTGASSSGSTAAGFTQSNAEIATGSSAYGATAKGYASQSSLINASGAGSHAGGVTGGDGTNTIRATSEGSFSQGAAKGDTGSSLLTAEQGGATALGYIENGLINSSGYGSFAVGQATGGGTIEATEWGSMAHGNVERGLISSIGRGSTAGGMTDISQGLGPIVPNSQIVSESNGSLANGFALSSSDIDGGGKGYIISQGQGSTALGYVFGEANPDGPGAGIVSINATGDGSFAAGRAASSSGNATILSSGQGSFATGNVVGTGKIVSSGSGSFAGGSTSSTTQTIAQGFSSFAFGTAARAVGTHSFVIGNNVNAPGGSYQFAYGQNIQMSGVATHQAAFFNESNPGVFMVNREDANASHVIVAGYPAGGQGGGAYLSKAGVWTDASSREFKEDYQEIDKQELLDDIESMEIYNWKYKNDNTEARHIGPFAEDMHDTFGVGENRKYLATLDVAGVNMVAIQQLIKENKELKQKNEELEARLDAIEARLE